MPLKRIDLKTTDDKPSRPRGVAITHNGRYAAITGLPRGEANSSMVWLVDLVTYQVKGRVTGIGNESYMIAPFQAD